MQVSKELQQLTGRDHQLLHLYINIQNDISERRNNLEALQGRQGEHEEIQNDRRVRGRTHEDKDDKLRTCWSSFCCLMRGATRREESSGTIEEARSRNVAHRNGSATTLRKRNTEAIKINGSNDINGTGYIQGHSRDSGIRGEGVEKVRRWARFVAVCTLSFCRCCFRRKKKNNSTLLVEEGIVSCLMDLETVNSFLLFMILAGGDNIDGRLHHDFRYLFLQSGFNDKPERSAYIHFEGHLGNVELLHQVCLCVYVCLQYYKGPRTCW